MESTTARGHDSPRHFSSSSDQPVYMMEAVQCERSDAAGPDVVVGLNVQALLAASHAAHTA